MRINICSFQSEGQSLGLVSRRFGDTRYEWSGKLIDFAA